MIDPEQAERLAEFVAEQDRAAAEKLKRRGGDNIRDQWVVQAVETHDDTVVSQPAASYRLPSGVSRFLDRGLVEEMEQVLAEVQAANEGYVGLKTSVARIMASHDPLASDVTMRLRAWAERYVTARLARPNTRDRGDPVLKFRRLSMEELLPFIDELGHVSSSVHNAFLGEVADYAAWLLHRATWAHLLDYQTGQQASLTRPFRVLVADEGLRHYCQELAQLYLWQRADLWLRTCDVVHQGGVALPRMEATAARAELAARASDLEEMRPALLTCNVKKTMVELAPNLLATWMWGGGTFLGVVPLSQSVRETLTSHQRSSYHAVLKLDQDGILSPDSFRWLDAEAALHQEPDSLSINLLVVDALHARLFEIYEKVDLSASFRRAREAAASETAVLSDEDVAAVCQVAAAEEARTSPALTGPRPRIPTLRFERLVKTLRDGLGCEVRQGKGSEVVFFRPGGRIARVGCHRRNREVPSTLVKIVLDTLGVTLSEWVRALG
jgi:hypothetical protein